MLNDSNIQIFEDTEMESMQEQRQTDRQTQTRANKTNACIQQ
jgi:hypothetical protein